MTPAVVQDPPGPGATAGVWLPRRSHGGEAALWVGIGLSVLAVAAGLLSATFAPGASMFGLALTALLLAVAGAAVLLWALSYRQLAYLLGPLGLEIAWLGERFVIPYGAVEGIYTGQRLVGHATPSRPGWPGIFVGSGRAPSLGRLQFYATSRDPADLALVAVDGAALVLSARDPHGFRAALIERVRQHDELAPTPPAARRFVLPASGAPWSTLRDRWFGWAIGAATLLLVAAVAVVAFRYVDLPDLIPLRFDAAGRPNLLGPPTDLLKLPSGGLLVLLANLASGVWLHPREQVLARLLWVGAALVQANLLIAVVRLVQ